MLVWSVSKSVLLDRDGYVVTLHVGIPWEQEPWINDIGTFGINHGLEKKSLICEINRDNIRTRR